MSTEIVDGIRVFGSEPDCRAWMDGEAPEGTDPVFVAIEHEKKPWKSLTKTERIDLRARCDQAMSGAISGMGEFARTEYFAFNGPAGRATVGAASFRPGPNAAPVERAPRTPKGAMELGVAVAAPAVTKTVTPEPGPSAPPAVPEIQMSFSAAADRAKLRFDAEIPMDKALEIVAVLRRP